jgi:ABC-type dipeptide/oligopeptide/nickel transport system permease component
VLALFTVSALLTLTGILISDLLLAAVDPRIVFGRRQQ